MSKLVDENGLLFDLLLELFGAGGIRSVLFKLELRTFSLSANTDTQKDAHLSSQGSVLVLCE